MVLLLLHKDNRQGLVVAIYCAWERVASDPEISMWDVPKARLQCHGQGAVQRRSSRYLRPHRIVDALLRASSWRLH
ncbi:hypothetical protein D3C71_1640700 [compost metagenome]